MGKEKEKVGRIFSQGTRERMSVAKLKNWQDKDYKKHMSEAHKGNPSGMLGRRHTQETKDKISKAGKGQVPWNKGKNIEGHPCTEGTRKKISEAIKREKNGGWKGGFTYSNNGYLQFKPPKGCKFYSMQNSSGYIMVHRLIMAAYLQRLLKEEEVVHHINENKKDNRIENLKLLENTGEHTRLHNNLRKNRM